MNNLGITFQGKLNRSEFITKILLTTLLPLIPFTITLLLRTWVFKLSQSSDLGALITVPYLLFIILYAFWLILYTYSLYVRRLNDLGKSKWWVLLLLIPIGSLLLTIY